MDPEVARGKAPPVQVTVAVALGPAVVQAQVGLNQEEAVPA